LLPPSTPKLDIFQIKSAIIFVNMDYVPSNTKVVPPLEGVKILQTDPVRVLDEFDTWTGLFNETLLKRTRSYEPDST
jgi:hypothetical protein